MLERKPMHRSARVLFVALLFSLALVAYGCGGGSSSSTTKTTGSAPTFTSTAPTVAEEGSLYSYNLSASTTDGSTVAFSLTSGPSGATVSGSTLTWTPTHEEARTSNSFAIKATTSANGVASQSFSITPTGNINGTAIDHAITGNGLQDYPENLTAQTVEILFANGQGGYDSIHGTGDANGNFSIPNVPSGSFWLHLSSTQYGATYQNYVWTNASTIDAGRLISGRGDAVAQIGTVTINPNVTLGVPISPTDSIAWQSADAFAGGSGPAPTSQTYTSPFQQSGNLIDSSKGDRAYLLHYQHASSGADYAVEELTDPSVTETDGGTVNVNGSMSAVGNLITDPVIKITQFEALFAALPHNSVIQRSFEMDDAGYDGAEGCPVGVRLIHFFSTQINTDIDLGALSYGKITANGAPCFYFFDEGQRTFSTSNATFSFPMGSGVVSNVVPTSSTPIVPVVGMPQSPMVEGVTFYNGEQLQSLTPAVTWNAPGSGTADFYILSLTDLTEPSSGGSNFYTADNSVAVPPGVIENGHAYVMTLQAVSDTKVVLATAPFRVGPTPAYSIVTSGALTTPGYSGIPKPSTKAGKRQVYVHVVPGAGLRLQSTK